ncbi:TPA: hypothetical protein HA265_02110 [Candidatus Woesearchaeota archaeon]|nr:hypothetical protein [Candidatus Woesearchaeota archaeon]
MGGRLILDSDPPRETYAPIIDDTYRIGLQLGLVKDLRGRVYSGSGIQEYNTGQTVCGILEVLCERTRP